MHRLEPLHLKQMLHVFQKNKYHLVWGGDSPRGMRGRGRGKRGGERGWTREEGEGMGRRGEGFHSPSATATAGASAITAAVHVSSTACGG